MLNIHEIAPHVNIDKKCFEKIQFLLVDIRFYTAIFDAVQIISMTVQCCIAGRFFAYFSIISFPDMASYFYGSVCIRRS